MAETPFWRWMRACALQESKALRAYARAGMQPPPYVPIDVLATYSPKRKLHNMIPVTSPELNREIAEHLRDGCGTDGAYHRHLRNGEEPCQVCKNARALNHQHNQPSGDAVIHQLTDDDLAAHMPEGTGEA